MATRLLTVMIYFRNGEVRSHDETVSSTELSDGVYTVRCTDGYLYHYMLDEVRHIAEEY